MTIEQRQEKYGYMMLGGVNDHAKFIVKLLDSGYQMTGTSSYEHAAWEKNGERFTIVTRTVGGNLSDGFISRTFYDIRKEKSHA